MSRPLVSVLLPVYDGKEYLGEAVQSLLNQTYDNFELIIIDDGSSDDSASVITRFDDPRIRFFRQQNRGLAATLNRAIGLAQGQYLARHDQDDISFPMRFERQVAFLESHPRCGLLGTWAEIWVGGGKTKRAHRHPSDNLNLKFELLLDNPFVHSSVMIRKEAIRTAGLYSTDPSRQPPEDYELWSRISRHFEVGNIPEVLQVYREVPGSMSRTGPDPFLERLITISGENIATALSRDLSDKDSMDIAAIAHRGFHRLSGEPDFLKIEGLLFRAEEMLEAGSVSDRGRLRQRVNMVLIRLRHNYLRYRHGRLMGRVLFLRYLILRKLPLGRIQ